jgi:hypothetical protein
VNRTIGMVVALFALATGSGPAGATGDEELRALREENRLMRDQLDRQEERLDALEGETPAVSAAGSDPLLQKVVAGVPIQITGFLKGDMVWNDSRVNSTSAPRFSDPGQDGSDSQFTATVQHTRLGLRFGPVGLGDNGTSLNANVEMDYFNLSDSGDNNFTNNQLRVRHLWFAIQADEWNILAGQTWDVFSPLWVDTLNTNGNYWFGGNGGFRRPQLRVTHRVPVGEGHAFTWKASINANTGTTTTVDGRSFNSGRRSGIPVFEAALEWSFPGVGGGPIRSGAAGVWGQEDLKGVENNLDQWGIGGYVVVPITDWLKLSGEVQHGENLDAFLIGGGVNSVTGEEIEATSGWVQASLMPIERTTLNLTFGVDDPENRDLPTGAVSKNYVLGAAIKYAIFEPLVIGFEYQRFDTHYADSPTGDAHLFWSSLIFNF